MFPDLHDKSCFSYTTSESVFLSPSHKEEEEAAKAWLIDGNEKNVSLPAKGETEELRTR